MPGEFTKSSTLTPAIAGTLAKAQVFNQNLALIAKDSFIGVDEDGTPTDSDLGDETIGTNGTLIADAKVRTGKSLLIYDASGNLSNTIPYTDLVNVLDYTVTSFADLSSGSYTTGNYHIATVTTGIFTANYIYLKITTGSGWSEIIPFVKQQIYSVDDNGMRWWNGAQWIFANTIDLLETKIASASASIVFTDLSSAYKRYIIECTDVKMATDDVSAWVRVSSDNGLNYDAGASDYNWKLSSEATGGSNPTDSQISLNSVSSTTYRISNTAGEYFNATITIYNPSNASSFPLIGFTTNFIATNAGLPQLSIGTGYRMTAKAIDAIQFLSSSGNITSGTFKLYGVR